MVQSEDAFHLPPVGKVDITQVNKEVILKMIEDPTYQLLIRSRFAKAGDSVSYPGKRGQ